MLSKGHEPHNMQQAKRWTEATQEDQAIVVLWIMHKKVAAVTFSKGQEREKHRSIFRFMLFYKTKYSTIV